MAKKKKRKTKSYRSYLYFLIFALGISVWVFLQKDTLLDYYYSRYFLARENLHPSQTFIPSKYKVIGADISRYQEKFIWKKAQVVNQLKDTLALSFIIAKATEGTHLQDPLYSYNKQQAKKNPHIIFGAYHFFHPNKNVESQANHFVNTAQLQKGDLLPVIDIEQTKGVSHLKIRERLNYFCNLLENKYGKKPIIYSNKDFLLKVVGAGFKEYPIWVAHYGVSNISLPNDWKWSFWQLTDEGSTFATPHPVDINVFNGSQKELKNLLIN